MDYTWIVPRQLVLVRVGRVVLLGDVVEHQHVGERLEAVREVARHVHGSEVAVADVLAESLPRVAVEGDDARPSLQADEQVVPAPLMVMQASNRSLPREGDVRLTDRLRQAAG